MPGLVARNTSRSSFRLQCHSCSSTRPFNRPGTALPHIRMWRASKGGRPARSQPGFDLGEAPHDTTGGDCEPSRKLAALFHLIDRTIGKRDHLAKLIPPYGALDGRYFPTCHFAFLQAI